METGRIPPSTVRILTDNCLLLSSSSLPPPSHLLPTSPQTPRTWILASSSILELILEQDEGKPWRSCLEHVWMYIWCPTADGPASCYCYTKDRSEMRKTDSRTHRQTDRARDTDPPIYLATTTFTTTIAATITTRALSAWVDPPPLPHSSRPPSILICFWISSTTSIDGSSVEPAPYFWIS